MNIGQKILLITIGLFLGAFLELHAQSAQIYGKVLDSNTGERLNNVTVSLILGNNTVSQTRTEEDGTYTFTVTQAGNYQLNFQRAEYDDFSYTSVRVRAGESMRRDAMMQRPPRFISVTEVGNHSIEKDYLDIGDITTPQFFYVDFFNSGGVDIHYVTGKMSEWITEVTPSSGTLRPNESNRITIRIDPDKFEAGETTGKVLIITNNGNRVLPIKAIGRFPEIITLPIVDVWPSRFESQINFNGRHTFIEMGYVFSDIDEIPTTINGNVVLVSATHLSTFTYSSQFTFAFTGRHSFPWLDLEITNLFPPEFFCRTYYVRAFLRYANGVVIYSDNVEQFTLMEFMCDWFEW